MQTITYNPCNWSDSEDFKVNIKARSFKSTHGFTGTYKQIEDSCGTYCKVNIEGSEFLVIEYSPNYWVCEEGCVSREDSNPVVAALQVAHNTL